MKRPSPPSPQRAKLLEEIRRLRARLDEAEQTLDAIRRGEVDAMVVGEQVYTLKGAETPYRSLIEAMNEGAGTLQADGTFLYANQRLAGLLQAPLETLIGTSLRRFVPPADQPAFDALLAQGSRGSSKGDLSLQGPNATVVPVQLSFSAMAPQDAQAVGLVVTDLTERKRAEAALAAERQRFYTVLETLPAMVCLLTPDYHVPFANRAFRERFGEARGRPCYEYCYGRKQPCEFCESYTVLKTGQPHHWELTGEDGTVISAYDFPFTDMDGAPMILEMDLDITEVRHAQAALKAANESLEQRVAERTAELQQQREWLTVTLASIGDALIATDAAGRITFINPVAEALTGWPRQEALGQPVQVVFRIVDEITRVPGQDLVARVLQEGGVVKMANNMALIARDGREIPIEDSAAPIKDSAGKVAGVVLVFHDVTPKRRAQQQLRGQNEELARFNRAMVGRELRMIELKKEVDALCVRLGETPRYGNEPETA